MDESFDFGFTSFLYEARVRVITINVSFNLFGTFQEEIKMADAFLDIFRREHSENIRGRDE